MSCSYQRFEFGMAIVCLLSVNEEKMVLVIGRKKLMNPRST